MSGMPPNVLDSRTSERPTKASGPAKVRPRVKPGSSTTVSTLPASRSTTDSVPSPDSRIQRRSRYQRGEWGIDRPETTVSSESTSIRTPPRALFWRQPPASSLSPNAVTNRTRSSITARPFRWQRSSAASAVTNGGRQRGTKLCSSSRVARQEKRVATIHSSPPA